MKRKRYCYNAFEMSATPPRRLWPLMALACARDGVLSPVQMQKALFLMEQRAGDHIGGKLYDFIPHNYGPFSAGICRDIGALNEEGDVAFAPNQFRAWNSYELTAEGRKKAEAALDNLNPRLREFFRSVVQWVAERDFPDLLRAIYREYPHYAENSVFRGRA